LNTYSIEDRVKWKYARQDGFPTRRDPTRRKYPRNRANDEK
jgi:hypothetical protein